MANPITIDGVSIKTPDEFEVQISDLDSEDGTGRNQAGKMFRDRVTVKRKLTLSWGFIKGADVKTILDAVEEEFVSVTYPDPMTNANKTIEAYVSDRSCSAVLKKGSTWYWQGLSFSLTER